MKTLHDYLRSTKIESSLIELVELLAETGNKISHLVRQGALANILGAADSQNIQGEDQKKLDVIANQMIKDTLINFSTVAAIASEEEDSIVPANSTGKFLVAFDPLDGSSNIDINGQIGSIFTIYPRLADLAVDNEAQFLQPGRQQLAAGYILYGPSTQLVMSLGKTTQCFTLDESKSTFVLTNEQMQIAKDTQEFSINMSNQRFWSEKMRHYIGELILGASGSRGKNFNMRWNGAMVGDVHRVMMRGGIFLYPSDNRNPKQPAKLRLLYEANPIAMLVENAGGKALNESQSILTIQPKALHERVAVILGSANEVDSCMSA
ncbi:MAG: class 1 fructose-bisphosphatase [Cellvibrio sp.]|nr:class 1 fructose-bisphosphatase [Cellvibrio sp.]